MLHTRCTAFLPAFVGALNSPAIDVMVPADMSSAAGRNSANSIHYTVPCGVPLGLLSIA